GSGGDGLERQPAGDQRGTRAAVGSAVANRAAVRSPAVPSAGGGDTTHRLISGGQALERETSADFDRSHSSHDSVIRRAASVAQRAEEIRSPAVRLGARGNTARVRSAGDEVGKRDSARHRDWRRTVGGGAISELAVGTASPAVRGAQRRETAREIISGDDIVE